MEKSYVLAIQLFNLLNYYYSLIFDHLANCTILKAWLANYTILKACLAHLARLVHLAS